MTTPDLRAGMRIRLTIEGEVSERSNGDLYLTAGDVTPFGLVDGGGFRYSLLRAATVEILAQPRPPEPMGLGAVVKAHTSVHPERRPMYRTERGHWWDRDEQP